MIAWPTWALGAPAFNETTGTVGTTKLWWCHGPNASIWACDNAMYAMVERTDDPRRIAKLRRNLGEVGTIARTYKLNDHIAQRPERLVELVPGALTEEGFLTVDADGMLFDVRRAMTIAAWFPDPARWALLGSVLVRTCPEGLQHLAGIQAVAATVVQITDKGLAYLESRDE